MKNSQLGKFVRGWKGQKIDLNLCHHAICVDITHHPAEMANRAASARHLKRRTEHEKNNNG